MDELVLDGKTYVSSKRAAKITGYARDYVGQLCREGHVEARLVGRSWYVLETSIREHRFGAEKKVEIPSEAPVEEKKPTISPISKWEAPKYAAETAALLPEVDSTQTVNRIQAPQTTQMQDDPVAQMQAAWQDWFSRKQINLLENEPEELLLESPDIIDAREERNEIQAAAEAITASETPKIASYEPVIVAEEPVMLKKVAEVIENKRDEARSSLETDAESVNLRKKYPAPTFKPVNRTVKPASTVDLVREQPKMDRKTRIKLARQKERAARKGKGASALVRMLILLIAVVAIGEALIGTGYLDQFTSHYITRSTVLQYLVGERLVNKN